ncbi:MAG TPA: NifU family protein [Actinomycetota bacterium]|nr:NifU family protein [Actinomycetota bacterium]
MRRVADYNMGVEEAIRRLIDQKIRPSVQLDGGDVEFVGIEDGVVKVRMFGACDGCPMSPVTLRAGIERILKEEFPQIRDVVAFEA